MADFHGYLLLTRPLALSAAQWATTLRALYVALNKRSTDPSPAKRLHYRLSNSGEQVLVEASFDAADLTVNALATYIRTALSGAFTLTQVKTALANKVTVFGAGKGWAASRTEAAAYLAANAAEWEATEEAAAAEATAAKGGKG